MICQIFAGGSNFAAPQLSIKKTDRESVVGEAANRIPDHAGGEAANGYHAVREGGSRFYHIERRDGRERKPG